MPANRPRVELQSVPPIDLRSPTFRRTDTIAAIGSDNGRAPGTGIADSRYGSRADRSSANLRNVQDQQSRAPVMGARTSTPAPPPAPITPPRAPRRRANTPPSGGGTPPVSSSAPTIPARRRNKP